MSGTILKELREKNVLGVVAAGLLKDPRILTMRILNHDEVDQVYRDTQKRLPLTPGLRYLVSVYSSANVIIDGTYEGPDDELSVATGGYYLLFSDNQKIWSRNILHFVRAIPPLCQALAVIDQKTLAPARALNR